MNRFYLFFPIMVFIDVVSAEISADNSTATEVEVKQSFQDFLKAAENCVGKNVMCAGLKFVDVAKQDINFDCIKSKDCSLAYSIKQSGDDNTLILQTYRALKAFDWSSVSFTSINIPRLHFAVFQSCQHCSGKNFTNCKSPKELTVKDFVVVVYVNKEGCFNFAKPKKSEDDTEFFKKLRNIYVTSYNRTNYVCGAGSSTNDDEDEMEYFQFGKDRILTTDVMLDSDYVNLNGISETLNWTTALRDVKPRTESGLLFTNYKAGNPCKN